MWIQRLGSQDNPMDLMPKGHQSIVKIDQSHTLSQFDANRVWTMGAPYQSTMQTAGVKEWTASDWPLPLSHYRYTDHKDTFLGELSKNKKEHGRCSGVIHTPDRPALQEERAEACRPSAKDMAEAK
uniref:Uncharacterized protein n=1 Tax=Eutreptiella gymnastica TaxID=73025 RepID=A0A7S4CVF8_9EUGL